MEKIVKDKKFDNDLKNAEKLNKFLKYLKLFIILVIVLALVYFTKNAIILYSVATKYDEFLNCNNYHIQLSFREGDLLCVDEIYYKNGVSLAKHNLSSIEDFSEPKYMEHYDRNTGKITTFDNNDYWGKIYYHNDEEVITSLCYPMCVIASPSLFFNDTSADMTVWDYITYFGRRCVSSKIESTKLQGVNCYKITDGATYYIDKETGNLLRFHDGVDLNFYYEFDKVTDEDVKMPELNGYTLHEFES